MRRRLDVRVASKMIEQQLGFFVWRVIFMIVGAAAAVAVVVVVVAAAAAAR